MPGFDPGAIVREGLDPLIPTTETAARAFLDRTFPDARIDRVLLVTPPDAEAHIF